MSETYEPGTYRKGDLVRVADTAADAVAARFAGYQLDKGAEVPEVNEEAPDAEPDEADTKVDAPKPTVDAPKPTDSRKH